MYEEGEGTLGYTILVFKERGTLRGDPGLSYSPFLAWYKQHRKKNNENETKKIRVKLERSKNGTTSLTTNIHIHM